MASYLPAAVTKPLLQTGDLVRSAIGSISWGPVLSLSKAAVIPILQRIEKGTLVVKDQTTGQTTSFGQKIVGKTVNGNGPAQATRARGTVVLTVKKETFWVRMFLFADMGFAESYMLGEVECDDLTGFFTVRPSNG